MGAEERQEEAKASKGKALAPPIKGRVLFVKLFVRGLVRGEKEKGVRQLT